MYAHAKWRIFRNLTDKGSIFHSVLSFSQNSTGCPLRNMPLTAHGFQLQWFVHIITSLIDCTFSTLYTYHETCELSHNHQNIASFLFLCTTFKEE
uniref:Uncharacterized protein n=1 Tax=Anguilla anguilla TaxID=7936 RepID=A0A0E9XRV2_ANGAN